MAPTDAPQLYTQYNEEALDAFAPDVIYTAPTGDVIVGKKAVAQCFREQAAANSERVLKERLLQTPESLPEGAMVIDQVVLHPTSSRSLLVVKRRAQDGRIASLTEEAGHCKATVPLAARAGANNTLYSPTDNMVSPCTSKLNVSKRRHYLKGKPTALFAGASGAAPGL